MLAVECPANCESTSVNRLFERLSFRSTSSISSITHGLAVAVTPFACSICLRSSTSRHDDRIDRIGEIGQR